MRQGAHHSSMEASREEVGVKLVVLARTLPETRARRIEKSVAELGG